MVAKKNNELKLMYEDKRELKFTVLGTPQVQNRPRFAVINGRGRAYDTAESRNNKAAFRLIAQQAIVEQGWTLPSTDMPVSVDIKLFFPIPKSKTSWFKEAAALNIITCLGVKDLDNAAKLALDSMNGLVFPDDKQVFDLHVTKCYSDTPRTEIVVTKYYLNLGEIKAVAMASARAKKLEEKNGKQN